MPPAVPPVRHVVRIAANPAPVQAANFFDDLVPATEGGAACGAGPAKDMGVDPILHDLQNEIVLYKLLPPLPFYSDEEKTIFSNPLHWWKSVASRFPLLARRAQKVLAAMGTSAPSERVFSTGGNVVTKNRASMHADTVANLILLKQSLLAAKAFELKKSQNAAKR